MGLGSCWVGSFYKEKVSTILNLEENMIPVALLPFGYIGENSKPSSWHNDRKQMSEFAKKINN